MRKIPFLAFLLAFASTLAAREPALVRDLNATGPQSSFPGLFGATAALTYFAASTPETGREMWVSDGTTAGTRMIADMVLGPGDHITSSDAYGLIGGRLLYHGNSGTQAGVFITDGATIEKLASGAHTSSRTVFMNGVAYFELKSFDDPVPKLWRSDGTAAGTYILPSPIRTGSIFGLFRLGNHVYWSSFVSSSEVGLFRTDGTLGGSSLVTMLSGIPSVPAFTLSGRAVVLTKLVSPRRAQLWVTDGTAEGMTLLREFVDPQSRAFLHGVVGGRVLFTGNDGTSGDELWATDGTAEGTRMIGDLNPGPGPSRISVGQGHPVFVHDLDGHSLWTTDGTPEGTRKVKAFGSYAVPGVVFNGRYLFTVTYLGGDRQLWRSDGTEAGTVPVLPEKGNWSLFDNFVLRADGVLTGASDGVTGAELWLTDGTAAGTRLVKNIVSEERNSSNPQWIIAYNGRVLFYAVGDDFSGMWSSDGTDGGTVPVSAGNFFPVTVSNGYCFFRRGNEELWRTDGTAAGTIELGGIDGNSPVHRLPNGVVYLYDDGVHGLEPWVSDGTVAGTRLLGDLEPGPQRPIFYPRLFATSAGTLYIGMPNGLWRSDGTPGAAVKIMEPQSSYFLRWQSFAELGGQVYFIGSREPDPIGLWRTDGTAAGTVRMTTVEATPLTTLWSVGSRLVFASGRSLYASDGATGASLIADVLDTACSSEASVVSEGILYWSVGAALWRTDGTAEGTWRVTRALPSSGCGTTSMAAFNGRVYFSGRDSAHGTELWITNGGGAPDQTHLLHDIAPGVLSSAPRDLTVDGETLFFSAETPQNGRELFVLDISPAPRRRSVRH